MKFSKLVRLVFFIVVLGIVSNMFLGCEKASAYETVMSWGGYAGAIDRTTGEIWAATWERRNSSNPDYYYDFYLKVYKLVGDNLVFQWERLIASSNNFSWLAYPRGSSPKSCVKFLS